MRIIKGKKELFVLLNYMTRELKFNCSKSLKEKAQEKLKLTLSFRQAFFPLKTTHISTFAFMNLILNLIQKD